MAAPQKLVMIADALRARTAPKKSKLSEAMDKCDTPLEKLIEVLYAAHESGDSEMEGEDDSKSTSSEDSD